MRGSEPGRLRRFRRLPAEGRALLIRTALLFVAARFLVRSSELARTRRRLLRVARVIGARAGSTHQLAWAVETVNRHLPGHHSCLVQALACDAAAANSRITTEFRIGAAQQGGRMHFHAWVEHQGVVLTGAHEGEFAPLR